MLMTNAKKIAKTIVGIILLVIGLFIIIMFSMFSIVYILNPIYMLLIITGVFLFAIGLIFLMASWKKILAANAKEIVGFILLSIGLIIIILGGILMYKVGSYWSMFVFAPIIGVVLFVTGLNLLLTSRKKNSKSPDKSIT